MKKEDIQKRLTEVEKAIEEKNKQLQQANADLNVLIGCRAECMHWIHQFDQPIDLHPIDGGSAQKVLSKEELKQILGASEIEIVKVSDMK